MIFMGTQWIPHNKTEQWSKIFLEVNKNPLPSCIKKWQTFSSADGQRGIKGYNLIFTEKGKGDVGCFPFSFSERTEKRLWTRVRSNDQKNCQEILICSRLCR